MSIPEGYVNEKQHSRRPNMSLPQGGWSLFGCDCVTRRLHIKRYARSSFLVSLENRLSQNVIIS